MVSRCWGREREEGNTRWTKDIKLHSIGEISPGILFHNGVSLANNFVISVLKYPEERILMFSLQIYNKCIRH